MHQTIKKVTNDIEKFRYNTAISAIMEYVNLLRDIGANKENLTDVIDPAVGLEVRSFVGDRVEEGELLAELHVNDRSRLEEVRTTVLEAYEIGDAPVEKPGVILETIV